MFPLYDAGNIGMQMRKIWGVMLDRDFDPRAIAASRPIRFLKSMEDAEGAAHDAAARTAKAAPIARRRKSAGA